MENRATPHAGIMIDPFYSDAPQPKSNLHIEHIISGNFSLSGNVAISEGSFRIKDGSITLFHNDSESTR